jgi:hypothetical protein
MPADLAQPNDMPLYWFAALERAVAQGDFERAAEAQRNLRRLGVEVAFRPQIGLRQEEARQCKPN